MIKMEEFSDLHYVKNIIHLYCKKYNIRNYIINDDLSIDVEGTVNLSNFNLDYLPLNFNYVYGSFACSNNNLKSLKGCPKYIGGHFNCGYNNLTSLEGILEIEGDIICNNNNLISLKEVPDNTSLIYCKDNNIKSLEDFPKNLSFNSIATSFTNNPINAFFYLFLKEDNIDDLIMEFNDYSIIRGDDIILNRFLALFKDFNLNLPYMETVRFYYNVI